MLPLQLRLRGGGPTRYPGYRYDPAGYETLQAELELLDIQRHNTEEYVYEVVKEEYESDVRKLEGQVSELKVQVRELERKFDKLVRLLHISAFILGALICAYGTLTKLRDSVHCQDYMPKSFCQWPSSLAFQLPGRPFLTSGEVTCAVIHV